VKRAFIRHRHGGMVAASRYHLVDRNFRATEPDRLWVADITNIESWAGFRYLAVALYAFNRRILCLSMATTLAT